MDFATIEELAAHEIHALSFMVGREFSAPRPVRGGFASSRTLALQVQSLQLMEAVHPLVIVSPA